MEPTVGVIAQIVGMVALLLGGGIALGKLFSDNGTIKELLEKHGEQMMELVASHARLEAETRAMESEIGRVRNRLDQFVDGKMQPR